MFLTIISTLLLVMAADSKVSPNTYQYGEDRAARLISKCILNLPEDDSVTCDHPDIEITYNLSPKGKVYGVRLDNPAQDYLFYEEIVKSMKRWRFWVKVRDRKADTSRNMRHTFNLKRDFYQCTDR